MQHLNYRLMSIAVAAALCQFWTARVPAADPLPPTVQILPFETVLTGPHAAQQLVVEEIGGGQFRGDLTSTARFESQNPDLVAVDARGVVTPLSDGVAVIRAEVRGGVADTKIVVRSAKVSEPRSFRNEVQPVFMKAGCNMGACHGAQAGKKGFKLTLRGYDSEADYDTLTRQARGRRVLLSDPSNSLILLKATGAIPHGGGVRFEPGSPEYTIVSDWVAEGAPAPGPQDARLTRLEVFPQQAALQPGQTQQILVQAVYSDGRRKDVTRWAKFNSTEIGVATVDDGGQVQVAGTGETAITVWYASKTSVATISVAYANDAPPELFAQSPRVNFIDDLVLDKLQRLRIPVAPTASDGEFLRRAYLDTLGVLPTVEETGAFLADTAPDKRARLINSLFERPEYVDYWSYKWSDLLLVSTKKLKGPAVWAFYNWIRQAVQSNKPWNQFAREVVTARGSTVDNGAANYFVLHKDPQLLNEATSVTFLGMSIGCARCHDHPLERWTLDDYYGMANLFARVRQKDGFSDGEFIVYAAPQGDVKHPTRLGVPAPRPLDAPPLATNDPRDRREYLAEWLTAPENPYFARAIVNRVWANYMGRGLVEMVDDLRSTNPASNEPLLAALAAEFVKQNYDVRRLIVLITSSATYQRSALTTPASAADDRFYSHNLVRRMPAEVLLDALSQVVGVPTDFPDYPKGTRALQLPDSNVASYFLSAFGRPAREFTCECERTDEPSVTQTLHLANGKTLNDKLKAPGNTLDRWLDENLTEAQAIERLFLAALCRLPTPSESERMVAALADTAPAAGAEPAAVRAARRAALEDLFWAVLTSREFLFIH